MLYQFRSFVLAAMGVIIIGATSCSDDDNNPTPNTPPAKNIQVVANATYGNILTDSAGRTLYFFSMDASGSSSCSGGCVTAWPIFYKENPTLDSSLTASDFGVITRADGSKQTTYKGWPLYYYQSDAKAGDVKGEALQNVWFVAKPDYTVMLANTQLVGNDGVKYKSDYTAGDEITQYITDAYGRTLYAFAPDKFNTNTYTKADLSNNTVWPMFEVSAIKNAPSTLNKTSFATITVFGKTQLTFKGWPLYYFGADAQTRGNTKGVSVPRPGVWPIVNNNSSTAPQP